MLLSCVIVVANYTSSEVVVIAAMSLAFFAKGFGNLGWCVLSDTSPKRDARYCRWRVQYVRQPGEHHYPAGHRGDPRQPPTRFDYAILYVGSMGVLGLFSYLFIVGPLDRLTLTPRTV